MALEPSFFKPDGKIAGNPQTSRRRKIELLGGPISSIFWTSKFKHGAPSPT